MRKILSMLLTLLTFVLALLYFYPVLIMFITGFKTEGEAINMPPSFHFKATMANFHLIWNNGVAAYLGHSVLVTVFSTVAALLLGVPVAYAIAMFRMRKADDLLFWFISTKMLPAIGVLVPIYLMFKKMHLLDTPLALIILYTAWNVPLVVWMMRSFFKEIPPDLIESSGVDGAGGLQTFFKITLPLSLPGIMSTSLLCLVFSWNEFMFGVSITDTNASTMSVFMSTYMTQEGLFWAKMSAVASIAVLPALLFGWFTQKQLVRGLTMGAIKG